MEESGGIISSNENKKTLYQKCSLNIQDSLNKNIDSMKPDMIETMKNAQKLFEQISLVDKRANIELCRYNSMNIPALLDQYNYLVSFYLFGVILGFIDSKINYSKEEIKSLSVFRNDFYDATGYRKKEIEGHRELIDKMLKDREEVVSEYTSIINEDDGRFLDVFLVVLKTCPSYLKFTDLYRNSEDNTSYLNLQQHLVSAYNIGYVNKFEDYDKSISAYRKIFNELHSYMYSNKAKIEKEKVKQKQKIKNDKKK